VVATHELPRNTHVTLEVFDIRGRRVATILDEPMSAGEHRASWAGKDDVGRSMASGVYFARLRYPGEQMIKKMTVIK
jgi:flagellar hook assembly protein FlgD